MRYLGAFPSEKDIIKKILPEVRSSLLGCADLLIAHLGS